MKITEELIQKINELPAEEQDIIFESMAIRRASEGTSELDEKWGKVASRRLEELRSGKVKAIPGAEVVKEIRAMFE